MIDKESLLKNPSALNLKRANLKSRWLKDPVDDYIQKNATNDGIKDGSSSTMKATVTS